MDFERARKQGMEGRVYETLERAKEAWAHLNTAVIFVDPRERLKKLGAVGVDAAMYGTSVVLKDNVSTKGIRTTASSHTLDNYIPVYNTHIVDKLQATGTVVTAKASTGKLGMGGTNRNTHVGPVNNAWDENRISGGSSGGSAVLVAAGAAPFAIGMNTGDSVRKPAAYQGTIGMKPTYRGVSRYGIIPYTSSLDHVGYFTMSVQDTAVALEVLAGHNDRDMTSSSRAVEAYIVNLNHDLREKRIAVLDNVQEAVANPTVRENFDVLMKKLEAYGAAVTRVRVDDKPVKALMPTYCIIADTKATANRSSLDGIRFGMRGAGENVEDVIINTRAKGLCSYICKRFVIGSYSLLAENQDKILHKAQKVHRLIMEGLNHVLVNNDVVIASAAGTIVPLAEESKDSHSGADNNVAENHMVLGNFTGYLSMTMPTGFVEGISIDINMTTKTPDEQTLSNIRLAIGEETGLKGNDAEVDA